jgi:tRNA-modifying protein YgfZ
MTIALNGIAPVPHLGVIRAAGEDGAKFLHAQLTQDFALMRADEARLAAFCTAKGRMLASFVAIKRSADEIVLVCSREVLPAALKRLQMFVLRSKAKLSDATGEFELRGIAGDALVALAAGESLEPWRKLDRGAASVAVLYPADGQPRALWLAPAGEPVPEGPPLSTEMWQWGEVRSAVADITPPIVEAFVPQMLNYESVGGVNFKKGCYPGQEVVARSQFRGTLKRRAYLVHAADALTVGQEVFHESDREQPTGVVAQAAPAPGGGWDAVVSMQVSSAEAGKLTAGGPDGTPLQLQTLPYLLLADL